jgi:signal peptidase II
VGKLLVKKPKYWIISILPLFIIALDQWTKSIITDRFRLGETLQVFGSIFNITYVRNPGAAFGLLAQAHPSFRIPFFLAIPIIALTVIILVFRKLPDKSIAIASALSLVVGGAVGNLIDRLHYSYVVDFLDFHWADAHFPAFNVADSAICVGVGILVLDILRQPEPQPKKKKPNNASSLA